MKIVIVRGLVYFSKDRISQQRSGRKEGKKVKFLAPDKSGIYSLIETHIPNEVMQFKHIASVVNGKEQAIDEDSKKWSGATEIYSLIEGKESIELKVQIDILDEHLEYMKVKFPIALEVIKKNSLLET